MMDKLSLSLDVRGSNGIKFEEGWRTGNMKVPGLEISTVWDIHRKQVYGGCIDRDETKQLHEYLGKVIAKWDSENEKT